MEFQIVDWDSYDVMQEDTSEEIKTEFIIKLFGRTAESKSIYLEVHNYHPYFHIEIADGWNPQIIESQIRQKIYSKFRNHLISIKVVKKYKFDNFTNNKLFTFLELKFLTHKAFSICAKILQNPIYINGVGLVKFKLYESNLHPLLKFMHDHDLTSCGWVNIAKYDEIEEYIATTDFSIKCDEKYVCNKDKKINSDLIILSYDIECTSIDGTFPQAKRMGDKIIQIGVTLSKLGSDECYYQHLLSLYDTAEISGVVVESFSTEADLLLAFSELISKIGPNIITGYNIFGFDYKYMYGRAVLLDIEEKFSMMSQLINYQCEFVTKDLSSKALGKNILKFYKIPGTIIIDLFNTIKNEHKLPSYKLDYVASHFIREKITKIEDSDNIKLYSKCDEIKINQYVHILYDDGFTENDYGKFLVKEVNETYFSIDKIDLSKIKQHKLFWTAAKDDIKPHEIFSLFKGDKYDRAKIGKYCIMDCALCNKLINKLRIVTNGISMSNVCSVPLSYLFLRGQGIKIYSLISRQCHKENYLIPTAKKPTEELPKYEGALVIIPKKGIYFDPIGVLDYVSLYPSSMICKNISHETLVVDEEYLNLKGYKYHHVKYTEGDKDVTCIYAEGPEKGIIPRILLYLLSARKACRDEMKKTTDKNLLSVLDGNQLAFKLTANSLYGQTGASTSAIFKRELAASTTATGRDMLQYSVNFIENIYQNIVNLSWQQYLPYVYQYYESVDFWLETYEKIRDLNVHDVKFKIIYGDTDSVFFSIKMRECEDKLIKAIKLAQLSSEIICTLLPKPMKMEYEKTYYPFIILTKKRYVGNLYTDNANKFYQKSMGIVLKRRDNAPIVKFVCGGIIDQIMNKLSDAGAMDFAKMAIINIIKGNYGIDKFIITKTLTNAYKDKTKIAHAMLADRMTKRDPGNSPQINDRIPYVYIKINNSVKVLQSDRIEHPDYVLENNLKIDYIFYLTNQIMKPALQFLNLISKTSEKMFNNLITLETNRNNGKLTFDYYLK